MLRHLWNEYFLEKTAQKHEENPSIFFVSATFKGIDINALSAREQREGANRVRCDGIEENHHLNSIVTV